MFTKPELAYKMCNKSIYYYSAVTAFTIFFVMIIAISGNNYLIPAAHAEETVDGGQLYNQYCAVCHKSGLNAAPKIGNKALWIKRVQQGRETVYSNAINGLRGMPARGGYSQLTDEEVKAATDYMVGRSGGWGE